MLVTQHTDVPLKKKKKIKKCKPRENLMSHSMKKFSNKIFFSRVEIFLRARINKSSLGARFSTSAFLFLLNFLTYPISLHFMWFTFSSPSNRCFSFIFRCEMKSLVSLLILIMWKKNFQAMIRCSGFVDVYFSSVPHLMKSCVQHLRCRMGRNECEWKSIEKRLECGLAWIDGGRMERKRSGMK